MLKPLPGCQVMARRTRRQAMGQHFLVDESVADRIVAAAELTSDDRVLEIGPGHGVLTERLMDICPVTAIEKDEVLAATLRARWGHRDELDLIEGDALKVDWPPFTVLVSNLPYSVATPILLRVLEGTFASAGEAGQEAQAGQEPRAGEQASAEEAGWRRAVVMVQAEVAKRLVSGHGRGYGRLSVAVAYRAFAKRLFAVSRTAFSPQPRVHSAVVEMSPLAQVPFHVSDEPFFFDMVARLFNHRRKTLRNCLKLAYPELSLEEWEDPAELEKRTEELSPADLARLAEDVRSRLQGV